MTSLRKALLFGLIAWLLPFLVAFVIFPLRQSARPPFESIMPVALALTVVALALLYFEGVSQRFVREGVLLGLLWLAVSVLIDLPLFLFGGPMQMTFGAYVADVGATYVMMPVIAGGIGVALARARAAGTGR